MERKWNENETKMESNGQAKAHKWMEGKELWVISSLDFLVHLIICFWLIKKEFKGNSSFLICFFYKVKHG